MKILDAFPSGAWLKAEDLKKRQHTLVMDRVTMEEVGGEPKPVLYFKGREKGLVLNKTNANAISEMYGGESDAWSGKNIVLFPTRVDFSGKMVDAIRVQHQTADLEPAGEDEIPF